MHGRAVSKFTARRWNNDIEHARCAWVIASDLAARALSGDMRKVVQGTGKVGRGSDDQTAECRKIACYLAAVVANCSPARLAQASGLNRATIHKHLASVEDRRDDPAFDRMIDGLQEALFSMAARVVLAKLGETAPTLEPVA